LGASYGDIYHWQIRGIKFTIENENDSQLGGEMQRQHASTTAPPTSSTLRTGGHRITRQRQLVLDVLQDNPGHPDAETIFFLAKARDPRISLATVYRTLSLLNETGLVLKHSLGEGHGHFEAAQSAPHYHFTCVKCGSVIEFNSPKIIEVAGELCDREGVQITEVHVQFSGICSDCRKDD
jgi:Fur family ferric uptake transcriptional regulator